MQLNLKNIPNDNEFINWLSKQVQQFEHDDNDFKSYFQDCIVKLQEHAVDYQYLTRLQTTVYSTLSYATYKAVNTSPKNLKIIGDIANEISKISKAVKEITKPNKELAEDAYDFMGLYTGKDAIIHFLNLLDIAKQNKQVLDLEVDSYFESLCTKHTALAVMIVNAQSGVYNYSQEVSKECTEIASEMYKYGESSNPLYVPRINFYVNLMDSLAFNLNYGS